MESRAASWEEAAIVLTPYATLYRYPDAFPEPGADDLTEAVSLAAALLSAIEGLLTA